MNSWMSKNVILEGHMGIPFAHWFSKDSKFRYFFVLLLRNLGLGDHKRDKPKSIWIRDFLNWIDKYTFYRSEKEIIQKFSKYFKVHFIEYDYINHRILLNRKLKKIAFFFKIYPFITISSILLRKCVFMVILATKK